MTARTRTTVAIGSALTLTALTGCGDDQQAALPSIEVPDPVESTSQSGPGHATGWHTETSSGDARGSDDTIGSIAAAQTPWPLVESVDVDALDAMRTDTAEDDEAVLALMEAAGYDQIGEYVVTVETGDEVTALIVDWSEVTPDAERSQWTDAVEQRGALLLATVTDLDEIYFHPPGGRDDVSYIDRLMADEMVGQSLLEVGATRGGLAEILEILGR